MIFILIFRGVCNGTVQEGDEEIVVLGSLSYVEQEIKATESDFFLSKIDYEEFWGKIKLVGYTMQLRPEHMRLIAPALGLDYE